LFFLTRNKTVF